MLRGDVKLATLKLLGDQFAFEAFTDDNMNAAIAWAAGEASVKLGLTSRSITGTVALGSNVFPIPVPVLKPTSLALG